MVANPKFLAATAHVDDAAVKPLPNSKKVFVQGSRPDIRVPMREISQAETPASFGAEKKPPIYVYDTSGPYTDPQARIDIRSGLPALRARGAPPPAPPRTAPPPGATSRGARSPARTSRRCTMRGAA